MCLYLLPASQMHPSRLQSLLRGIHGVARKSNRSSHAKNKKELDREISETHHRTSFSAAAPLIFVYLSLLLFFPPSCFFQTFFRKRLNRSCYASYSLLFQWGLHRGHPVLNKHRFLNALSSAPCGTNIIIQLLAWWRRHGSEYWTAAKYIRESSINRRWPEDGNTREGKQWNSWTIRL